LAVVLTRPSTILRAACFTLALFFVRNADAFNMVIDYSYDDPETGFFATHPEAKASLEAAAGFFDSIILDNLAAITPSGSNTWSESFFNPSTGSTTNVSNPSVALGNFVVYAGAHDLGGTTLGEGGFGGFGSSGSASWNTLVKTRGQTGVDAVPPTDFASWGGSIAFDSAGTTWHYNHTTLPSVGENDFYSVALHELGHVLGLSLSDSWSTYQSGSVFFGPNVVALTGSGVSTVSSSNFHWANGTMSMVYGTSTLQEAAMDPTLTVGTRKYFTELDVASLKDVGWMVVPETDSWQLLASGGALIFLMRRQRCPTATPSENSHGSLVAPNFG
jgi:hypothetical protein